MFLVKLLVFLVGVGFLISEPFFFLLLLLPDNLHLLFGYIELKDQQVDQLNLELMTRGIIQRVNIVVCLNVFHELHHSERLVAAEDFSAFVGQFKEFVLHGGEAFKDGHELLAGDGE